MRRVVPMHIDDGCSLRFRQRPEPLSIGKLSSNARIERFDKGVLCWFARLDEEQFDAVLFQPKLHDLGRQFAAVVYPKVFGIPVDRGYVVEHRDDRPARETERHLERQTRTAKLIHHRERTECPSMEQPIVEVSSAGESHPRALAEPDVSLSAHPAPVIEPRNGSQSSSAEIGVAVALQRFAPTPLRGSYTFAVS